LFAPLVRSLHLNAGSDALIRSRGGTPGIAEMTWRQMAAPVEVAERLLIEPGTPVVHLCRVRATFRGSGCNSLPPCCAAWHSRRGADS